ncbi:conjugal transfer protein, partial [Enterobacter cancerogenus]
MTDEQRPKLTLRRKPAPDVKETTGGPGEPVRSVTRKKTVVVSQPPAWKLRKQEQEQEQEEKEKAEREAAKEAKRQEKARLWAERQAQEREARRAAKR